MSTPGDTMMHVGDIMSKAGVFQYTGGYHDECEGYHDECRDTMSTLGCGGYHEYTGGCLVHWAFHTNSIVFPMTFPDIYHHQVYS